MAYCEALEGIGHGAVRAGGGEGGYDGWALYMLGGLLSASRGSFLVSSVPMCLGLRERCSVLAWSTLQGGCCCYKCVLVLVYIRVCWVLSHVVCFLLVCFTHLVCKSLGGMDEVC